MHPEHPKSIASFTATMNVIRLHYLGRPKMQSAQQCTCMPPDYFNEPAVTRTRDPVVYACVHVCVCVFMAVTKSLCVRQHAKMCGTSEYGNLCKPTDHQSTLRKSPGSLKSVCAPRTTMCAKTHRFLQQNMVI